MTIATTWPTLDNSRNAFPAARRWLTAALLPLALAATAQLSVTAQPPQDATTQDESQQIGRQVDRLVRQLQRGTVEQRKQAEQALLRMGPETLPYLPVVESRMPADFRVRLQRIIEQLERKSAEAVWRESRVTLEGQYRWPQLVAEIERQTGNRLQLEESPPTPLDLNIDDQPFWPTLDRLLDQSQLDIDPYAGATGTLVIGRRVNRRAPRIKRVDYAGPLRIEPLRIDVSQDLLASQPAVAHLRLQVSWEPRLTPIAVSFPFDSLVAVDDLGASRRAIDPQAFPSFPIRPGTTAVDVAAAIEAPPRAAKSLESIRGECELLLPGELARFVFRDLSKPAKQQVAGVKVELTETRKNGDVWEVRINVAYDEAFTALDSHRGWVQDNPVFLQDAAGNRIESLGLQLTAQGRRSLGLAFLFDLNDEPSAYELHYATPAKLISKRIRFQLREIPLP